MRLYRFDSLIAQKADAENKEQAEVKKEILSLLGIQYNQFLKIRRKRVGEAGLKTEYLILLANYFGVDMQDLLNPKASEAIIEAKGKPQEPDTTIP